MKIKQIEKTFTRQLDQSDCGVACLLSVVKFYGGATSLEKLREESGTNKQGTTLLGLFQSSQQNGFESQGCEADIQALIKHGEPLILHVLIEKRLEHYVVCYGYKNDKFIIGDPAKGIINLSKEELLEIWQTKKCLTLKPNQNFVKVPEIKKVKKTWLLRLIKEDFSLLGISVVLGVVISVLSMALSVFSQKLIDDILPSKDMQRLITDIVFLLFLLGSRAGLFAVRQFMLIKQSKDFNNRIVDNFYSSLLFLPKPFFDTRKIGELVARLNDTSRIQKVISQIAGNVVIDLLMTFVSFGFLYFYSVKSALVATAVLPIYFFLVYRYNQKIINAQKEVMVSYALSESNYISTIQGVSVIKSSNRQNFFSKLNKIIYSNFQDKIFSLGRINISLTLLTGLFSIFFLVLILFLTSIDVYHDILKVGELMAILGIISSLLPSISNLALISIPINEAKIAFDRMFEFVNISPEKNKGNTITEIQSVELKDVSFRFPGRFEILKKISLKVTKGEIISIVGESGCGKSTLAQILLKFYTTQSTIKINDSILLNDIKTNEWRKFIEVVPQEIHLFNGTVFENISLSETATIQDVYLFCTEIGLTPFIEKFPQGFSTLVGEEGVNLSGGQKQIVALARALYSKPQLLILDEATSALDRETEAFILELLNRIKEHLSIIFISHRLHIIPKISNKIYVIDKGIISVGGTHADLLKTNNFYSKFWL